MPWKLSGVGSANIMKTLMLQDSSIVVCIVKQYGITISAPMENEKEVLTDERFMRYL